MSTWVETAVVCPRCARENRLRIARGVHVTRVPHVRDEVLARCFQQRACAGCAAMLAVHAPFVYTDFDRRHWLLVALVSDAGEWPVWEHQQRDDLARAFDHGSPLAHALGERMLARVVFGVEELREKLVLWSAGLEDALVECIKVRAFAEDFALAAPGSRLLIDRIGDDDALHAWWFARAGDRDPARTIELPNTWLREAERDRASLRARFSELWNAGFVSERRLRSARI